MSVDLRTLVLDAPEVGETVGGVSYIWAAPEDRAAVCACAAAANEKFGRYYDAAHLYAADSRSRVLTARIDGRIVGALMVMDEAEGEGIGSVGCTSTHPDFQGRGIATTMVKIGTKYLQKRGLPTGFLGYTYTAIVPMYARAGYSICMRYFMGVKEV